MNLKIFHWRCRQVKTKKSKRRNKKCKNPKNGITLIALVITIIVMLILAGVVIAMVFGDNGILAKAQEASFRQEMSEIKESVDLKKAQKNLDGTSTVTDSFTQIKASDTNDWDEYLKSEIIVWGDFIDQLEISTVTKEYAKAHWDSILEKIKTQDGYIPHLYLIDGETANGKSNTYLYDSSTDVVYKIKKTTIGSHTVHSIAELDNQKGDSSVVVDPIEAESNFVTVGEISYYEPDLQGFSMSRTKIVYYNQANREDTKEVSAQEYISQGKPRTITEGEKTYVFHDYNEEGTSSKIWANIKIENNGIIGYWVWVPRYEYKIDTSNNQTITDTNHIDLTSEATEGYIIHPTFGEENNNQKGIWVSKYEPTQKVTTSSEPFAYYVPDLTGFDRENTYAEIYNSETESFTDVKISQIGSISEFATTNNWFDYNNQIWANLKIVNASGVEGWWVWVPRYAYNITGTETSIIFVDLDNNPLDGSTLPSNYVVHPAFLENGQTTGGLKGIWVSKYEPTQNVAVEAEPKSENVNPPNLEGYNVDRTYIECYNQSTQTFTEQTLRSILANNSVIDNNNILTEMHIDYSKIQGTWYNYKQKVWANIKVKNSNGDVEGWWVWVPKYAYNITGNSTDIIYLSSSGDILDTATYGTALPSNYIPHPAFNTEGAEEGIWVSKYEPVGTFDE